MAAVNAVELIKDRLDIVTALEVYANADFSRVSLNRERVSIKCPFHSDRSPSLTVYLTDNRFRCFAGCNEGKHGDVIDILRLAFNLSTADAIKQLRTDLMIDSGRLDQTTVARITEKRQALEQIKIDRAASKWTTDSLQWLYREIPKQSGNIQTDEELDAWAPLIHAHAQIEYYLDSLLFGHVEEWEKAEINKWTKRVAEGVKQIAVGHGG